LHSFWRK